MKLDRVLCDSARQFQGCYIIIRLEVRLRPNIGFTLRGNLAVFTRSAITQPKDRHLAYDQ